jgi:transcription elongation factor GreA
MTQQQSYLTREGESKLKTELAELTGPRREELSQRLRSAIQMGDLSENADYHKAKEDQGFLEGRIQEIEAILRSAVIIEENANKEVVSIGSRVTIQEADFPPETYHPWGRPRRIRATAGSRTSHPLGVPCSTKGSVRRLRLKPPAARSGSRC